MDRLFKLITDQIETIEKLSGMDVFINDKYSFLSKTKLSKLPSYNRWHLNQYCLFVKGNKRIYSHCQKLKPKFYKKISLEKDVIKNVCFCGVAEYVCPIIVNGMCLCSVSVSGFKGDFSQRHTRNLSKILNISPQELENIRNEMLLKPDNEDLYMHEIRLLAYIIENFVKNDMEVSNILIKENQVSNTYVISALDYIERNFSKNISVADVAKASFVSASYLQSLFSKFVGRSVSEEIALRRIQNGKELLCTTDYSVKYIAFECGFESAEYFSVVFKKICGITPLKFRKNHSKL